MSSEQPATPSIVVAKNAAGDAYEARVDGVLAGSAQFEVSGNDVVFTHTLVQPQWEGKGIGSALAKGALDDVVSQKMTIVPVCPFIAAYLNRHAEYELHVRWPV